MRLNAPYRDPIDKQCTDRTNCSMIYNETADLSSSHISSVKSQISIQGIDQYVGAYSNIETKFGKTDYHELIFHVKLVL